MQDVYDTLCARIDADAPDLLAQLKRDPPKAVAYGYQILPRIVPDEPRPATPPRAMGFLMLVGAAYLD